VDRNCDPRSGVGAGFVPKELSISGNTLSRHTAARESVYISLRVLRLRLCTENAEMTAQSVSLIVPLIVGLVAGWIASMLVKGGGFGLAGLMVVGVFGALIGEFLGPLVGIATNTTAGVVSVAIGAIVALSIFALGRRLVARRKSHIRPAEFRAKPDTELSESSAEKSEAPTSVFVSYRRGDSADVTGRIRDHLVRHFGQEAVFTDVDSIPLGVDFRQHLDRAVGQCEVLVAVVGPEWAVASESETNPLGNRDYVRIEIEAALKRDIPVIPVLVGGAAMPSDEDLPESIAAFSYRNATKIRPDPDFQSDISRLIQSLDDHLRDR
jgi:uncharacterized membrane protein YeaQ/YmgE (transglycosylase-associated protein family)